VSGILTKKYKTVLMILAAVITAASIVFFVRGKQNAGISSVLFETSNGWGYTIKLNDSLHLIDQPMIPGRQGNKGFSSKEDAQKTANLVMYKMRKGILPPAVSERELDSLGIK
jgi:hypothetical protein